MGNRPIPLNTVPTSTMNRHVRRYRPGLYATPEDDPNYALPSLWTPFREAFQLTGGSIAESYRLVVRDWDESRKGKPPRIESLRAIAKREHWHDEVLMAKETSSQA